VTWKRRNLSVSSDESEAATCDRDERGNECQPTTVKSMQDESVFSQDPIIESPLSHVGEMAFGLHCWDQVNVPIGAMSKVRNAFSHNYYRRVTSPNNPSKATFVLLEMNHLSVF
jgi:hypothetical protein